MLRVTCRRCNLSKRVGFEQKNIPRFVQRRPTTILSFSTTSTRPTTTFGTKNIQSRLSSFSDLVNSPSIKKSLPLIGNGAYLFVVSGFLMTDMLMLRVALVGGYTGLVLFHSLHPKPLKIPLAWSALFVFVNAGAASILAMDRWAELSPEEERLYNNHFSQLTRGQFYQLLCLGEKETVSDGTKLTIEGKVCSKLYFIEKGSAKVYHHSAFAAEIDEGGFVNDVAFQQGEDKGAYGTVLTNGDCSLIVWDQHELRKHLKSRADMERNTKYLLSEHLMKSLLKQREARQRQESRRSHLTDSSNLV